MGEAHYTGRTGGNRETGEGTEDAGAVLTPHPALRRYSTGGVLVQVRAH